MKEKTISQIASIIRKDWKSVHYSAAPYLNAMHSMNSVNDNFGLDSGKSIILYFLGNAGSWRGEVARDVKKELKVRLG